MSEFRLLDRSPIHRLNVLKNNTILGNLSAGSLQFLAEHARPLRLRRGGILWHAGERADSVACVVQGGLFVQKEDAAGRVAYLQLKKSGALLAHPAFAALLHGTPPAPPFHDTTLAAREDTILLVLAGAVLLEVIEREPRFRGHLIHDLSESLRIAMEDAFAERVLVGSALLAAKLLTLAAMEGDASAERVYLPYSQQELSRFMSMGARNISHFMGSLPAIRTLSGRRGVQIDSLTALRNFLRTAILTGRESPR